MAAKRWTKQRILELLDTNPVAVDRALHVLYTRQTRDERQDKTARHINNAGFSAPDARLMTEFAQRLDQWGSLTEKQRPFVKQRIRKYAGQLARIANEGAFT